MPPFSASFIATGGTAPYERWIDGKLPAGLTFENGTITGTPKESGTFTVTISAVDYGFFVGTIERQSVIGEPDLIQA